MKYEVYKIKRLWGGYASVRSSVVEFAKRTHRKVKIEYDGQYMIIDGDTKYEITAPPQIAQRTDKYMKKGKPYQLYDYLWSPVNEKTPTEYTQDGLKELHKIMKSLFSKKPLDKQEKLI
jgi:hypothetical protein